jgi:hypothetical protein
VGIQEIVFIDLFIEISKQESCGGDNARIVYYIKILDRFLFIDAASICGFFHFGLEFPFQLIFL